jgi:hypothetical protein
MPVASVHWYGSYIGWDAPDPPRCGPDTWLLTFWSNWPDPNVSDPNTFSRPHHLLWQVFVPAGRVRIEYEGFDKPPDPCLPSDTCFSYYVQLKPDEYFWQSEYLWRTIDDTFWLGITAVYPEDVNCHHPWGWKTRPQPCMDAAVRLRVPLPEPNMHNYQHHFEPIRSVVTREKYDVAFELDTEPRYIKTEQPFTGLRRWPHYEDQPSMAVIQSDVVPNYKRLVADDWMCRRKTPVVAAVWWGSYLGYEYRPCQGLHMIPPKRPNCFLLTIWNDVPAGADPCVPFSHPGRIIWQHTACHYDEVLVGYDKHPHGQPSEPVFRYSVKIPEENWFRQKDVNDIYWFSVAALYRQDIDPLYEWGWTNHKYVFADGAVAGYPETSGTTPAFRWEPIHDQNNAVADMSFMLFTEPECLKRSAPEYSDWVFFGKPDCWCYPHQCQGDIDGEMQFGMFWVFTDDLDIFKVNFGKKPEDMTPGGICADIDHRMQFGMFRVFTRDLHIFKLNFGKSEDLLTPPKCDPTNYNFWTSP